MMYHSMLVVISRSIPINIRRYIYQLSVCKIVLELIAHAHQRMMNYREIRLVLPEQLKSMTIFNTSFDWYRQTVFPINKISQIAGAGDHPNFESLHLPFSLDTTRELNTWSDWPFKEPPIQKLVAYANI